MNTENQKINKGINIKTRRIIAHLVLILITLLCLFWFFILIINATRSHSEMTKGFTPLPSSYLLTNWKNLLAGTLPVWSGLINSLIVAGLSALFSVYFSSMTAYGNIY